MILHPNITRALAQGHAASVRRGHECRETYLSNPKLCRCCGRAVPYERRRNVTCTRTCGALSRAKKIKQCSCGVTFSGQTKYCSAKCARAAMGRGQRVERLEDAMSDATRRRILVRERGHRCEECERAEWLEQPIPLELSHEDGDSDNNSRENLKLLCRNCHGLKPDHKGGARRLIAAGVRKPSARNVMRRRRYAQGQTY